MKPRVTVITIGVDDLEREPRGVAVVVDAVARTRSFLGRLTSEERAGEIYGLYATTGRAVSFLAPALISVAIALTGDSRAMVPAILVVLVLGMVLLFRVRDPRVDEQLGAR